MKTDIRTAAEDLIDRAIRPTDPNLDFCIHCYGTKSRIRYDNWNPDYPLRHADNCPVNAAKNILENEGSSEESIRAVVQAIAANFWHQPEAKTYRCRYCHEQVVVEKQEANCANRIVHKANCAVTFAKELA